MKLRAKFWLAMVIFSLVGQIAWVVENMYFNVFIYKMFHASASQISLMVAASSVAATITTILIGALSDRLGKRKVFMSVGYILWGLSILCFAFIRTDFLSGFSKDALATFTLAINIVIVMDCIMTFFGSMANDAAYNAWITDWGNIQDRGKIEGINAIMPLLSVLIVFGGFMSFDLNESSSWTLIFIIIGIVVLLIGVLGFFIIEEAPVTSNKDEKYWTVILHSFRPSTIKNHQMLYKVLIGFAIFGISIQIFMPYLILYYEQSLQMANYVIVMAPAIVIAAIVTALVGKFYDKFGFYKCLIPALFSLLVGYILLFFFKNTVMVFVGSLLMMIGNMAGGAMFGAKIRDEIPNEQSGRFQGIRIIAQVLIPGIIGPSIGAIVLQNAAQIINNDGTSSFLPDGRIWLAAFVIGGLLLIYLHRLYLKENAQKSS